MTTLSIFTQPFTMPDGTTRPPLVERVPELNAWSQMPEAWQFIEALLIVAAHRWVRRDRRTVDATVELEVMHLLHDWALHGRDDDLVLACHLIADALDSAKGNA